MARGGGGRESGATGAEGAAKRFGVGWRRAGFDETFERNSTEVGGHARDSWRMRMGVGWQQHAPEGPKAAVSLKRIVSLFISSHGK